MKRLLILFLILTFFGCKAKKKVVERTKEEKIEVVTEEKKSIIDSSAVFKTEVIEKEEEDVLEVIERETVIKTDSLGQTETKVKEKITRKVKTVREDITTDSLVVEVEKENQEKKEIVTEETRETKKVDKKSIGVSNLVWIIFLTFGIVLIIRYRKKIIFWIVNFYTKIL